MDYRFYKDLTDQFHDAANAVSDFKYLPVEVLAVLNESMLECEDAFVADNQARADQGFGPSFAGRDLFIAIQVYMEIVGRVQPKFGETPVPLPDGLDDNGARDLPSGDDLANKVWWRCIDWTVMMTGWFPVLMDDMIQHPANDGNTDQATGPDGSRASLPKAQTETDRWKVSVKSTDEYKKAVEDGSITPPFTWNGTKRALAEFVSRVGPSYNDRNQLKHIRWSVVGGVFTWKGKTVPGKDLNQTYQHIPDN